MFKKEQQSVKILLLLFILKFISLNGNATVIHVPSEQPTIQSGINAAINFDTVLVDTGVYFENINFNGKNIVVGSLFLLSNDTSYISQTIIDGNDSGSVVIFVSGEDSTAKLCGFTITNGFSYWPYQLPRHNDGGGIYCVNSDPILENLKISENNSIRGGGIYFYNSKAKLNNLYISGNIASEFENGGDGGGLFCDSSNILLSNTVIDSNIVWGNMGPADGAGVYFRHSNSRLLNVIIKNNSSPWYGNGGGICCDQSSPVLTNVIICNNQIRALHGGGIICYQSSPILYKVLIAKNVINQNFPSPRYGSGAGIYCWDNSNPLILNSTISQNDAVVPSSAGGIGCQDNSKPILVNSIVWNNSINEIFFSPYEDSNAVIIAFSNVLGGENGILTNNNGMVFWLDGNINVDPLFINPANNDYRLNDSSLCIDSGIEDTVIIYNNQDTIFIPELSYIGRAPDMGAYEYDPASIIGAKDNIVFQILLFQNYPNPFNPRTNIQYSIPIAGKVELTVYDILGREVTKLVNENKKPGKYSVHFNGSKYASGLYFYKLLAGDKIKLRKMLLIK